MASPEIGKHGKQDFVIMFLPGVPTQFSSDLWPPCILECPLLVEGENGISFPLDEVKWFGFTIT